jgi:hypothetical protein
MGFPPADALDAAIWFAESAVDLVKGNKTEAGIKAAMGSLAASSIRPGETSSVPMRVAAALGKPVHWATGTVKWAGGGTVKVLGTAGRTTKDLIAKGVKNVREGRHMDRFLVSGGRVSDEAADLARATKEATQMPEIPWEVLANKYQGRTVKSLKAEAEALGLSTRGNKVQLAEKIIWNTPGSPYAPTAVNRAAAAAQREQASGVPSRAQLLTGRAPELRGPTGQPLTTRTMDVDASQLPRSSEVARTPVAVDVGEEVPGLGTLTTGERAQLPLRSFGGYIPEAGARALRQAPDLPRALQGQGRGGKIPRREVSKTGSDLSERGPTGAFVPRGTSRQEGLPLLTSYKGGDGPMSDFYRHPELNILSGENVQDLARAIKRDTAFITNRKNAGNRTAIAQANKRIAQNEKKLVREIDEAERHAAAISDDPIRPGEMAQWQGTFGKIPKEGEAPIGPLGIPSWPKTPSPTPRATTIQGVDIPIEAAQRHQAGITMRQAELGRLQQHRSAVERGELARRAGDIEDVSGFHRPFAGVRGGGAATGRYVENPYWTSTNFPAGALTRHEKSLGPGGFPLPKYSIGDLRGAKGSKASSAIRGAVGSVGPTVAAAQAFADSQSTAGTKEDTGITREGAAGSEDPFAKAEEEDAYRIAPWGEGIYQEYDPFGDAAKAAGKKKVETEYGEKWVNPKSEPEPKPKSNQGDKQEKAPAKEKAPHHLIARRESRLKRNEMLRKGGMDPAGGRLGDEFRLRTPDEVMTRQEEVLGYPVYTPHTRLPDKAKWNRLVRQGRVRLTPDQMREQRRVKREKEFEAEEAPYGRQTAEQHAAAEKRTGRRLPRGRPVDKETHDMLEMGQWFKDNPAPVTTETTDEEKRKKRKKKEDEEVTPRPRPRQSRFKRRAGMAYRR